MHLGALRCVHWAEIGHENVFYVYAHKHLAYWLLGCVREQVSYLTAQVLRPTANVIYLAIKALSPTAPVFQADCVALTGRR